MRKGTYFKYLYYGFTITFTMAIILLGIVSISGHGNQTITPEPNLQTSTPGKVPLINFGGREVKIGNPNAPLIIIMYYSLTCPHCHEYQEEELPKIKKEYIDTGLVYFIYRDFPTDTSAIKAAKIAWCHGTQQYLAFARKLLETQDKWVPIDLEKLKEADKNLEMIALELGISPADYKKCLANENLEASILRSSFEAQKTYSISAAPAFLVNNEYYDGIVTADYIHNKLLEMGIHGTLPIAEKQTAAGVEKQSISGDDGGGFLSRIEVTPN